MPDDAPVTTALPLLAICSAAICLSLDTPDLLRPAILYLSVKMLGADLGLISLLTSTKHRSPATRLTQPHPIPVQSAAKRAPGRPREFNREDALHAAMMLFWRQGFEGTSLSELTAAMGISRPSLYAAFGDKASLFREAVLAYTHRTAELFAAALALPTAREVAETWLRLAGHLAPEPDAPTGCMILQGALVGSADTADLRAELTAVRRAATDDLAQRLRRAAAEGDLPPGADPNLLAEYLTAVAVGMKIGSVDGVSPQRLEEIATLALTHWPAGR